MASIKGAMMMLVEGETPKGPGIQMGMTGTRGTPDTIRMLRTVDQPEVVNTEEIHPESDKKRLLRTSDQQCEAQRGSPDRVGCSISSETKKDRE